MDAYVDVQIAVLTSGNMAMSLQVQLNDTILRPEGLLLSLQQNGLDVSSIALQSLDVEQVGMAFTLHRLAQVPCTPLKAAKLAGKSLQCNECLRELRLIECFTY